MQNRMIETPGAKIRENFGKSNRPRGGGVAGRGEIGLIALLGRKVDHVIKRFVYLVMSLCACVCVCVCVCVSEYG